MTLLPERAVEGASPRVREHFLQPAGEPRRYRGTMRRVWRARGWRGLLAAPALRLAARGDLLFAETGEDVPFEVEHAVAPHADGRPRMTWTRTFRFPGATRTFHAVMAWDPARGLLDDRLGRGGRLEVEMVPRIERGALVLESGRQWLRVAGLRVRVPAALAGHARVREWEEPDGRLGVSLKVTNPLLGGVFGYEGSFARVE